MITAVFPGSFDPPTYGHLNVVKRASGLFDRIDVLISVNPQKKYLFTPEERVQMLEAMLKPCGNVSVHVSGGLVVEYAEKTGAKVLIRGIRNASDFAYEFDLSLVNRSLNSNVETVFIPTEPQYFTVKSSVIKELASFGGDVSKMVPEVVQKALVEKFAGVGNHMIGK